MTGQNNFRRGDRVRNLAKFGIGRIGLGLCVHPAGSLGTIVRVESVEGWPGSRVYVRWDEHPDADRETRPTDGIHEHASWDLERA